MTATRINSADGVVLRGNGTVCGVNLFNTTLGSIIVAVCTSRPGDAAGDPPTMAMYSAGTWYTDPGLTEATTNHRQQIFWKVNESADAIASVEFEAISGAKDSFDMSIHVMEFSHGFTTPTLLASSSATSGGTNVNGLESGAAVAASGALAVSSGTIRRNDTSLTCGLYGNQNGTDWDTNESTVMSLDRFSSRASWIEGTGASENVEWGTSGATASMVALIAVIGEGAAGNTYTENRTVSSTATVGGTDVLTATNSGAVSITASDSGIATLSANESRAFSVTATIASAGSLTGAETASASITGFISGSDDLTLGSATATQTGFRWRNDDGNETTATWRAAQNSNTSIDKNTPIRIRFLIDTTGDLSPAQFKLQYRKTGSPTWQDVE